MHKIYIWDSTKLSMTKHHPGNRRWQQNKDKNKMSIQVMLGLLTAVIIMIGTGNIRYHSGGNLLSSLSLAVTAFQQTNFVGQKQRQNGLFSYGVNSRHVTTSRQILSQLSMVASPKTQYNNDDENKSKHNLSRRQSLITASGYISSGWFSTLLSDWEYASTPPANAAMMGLVQFPCKNGLMNTYHFMRAGSSGLEEEDLWGTNPLFLTNREDALTPTGKSQVQEACRVLSKHNINPSVIKYSLAAKCSDTSNIIANEMHVGMNRLIPEFTFMDPRGIGKWDMMPLKQTEKAVWALDHDEAGVAGLNGKPPPNDDGTANETLNDQVIRLRQLMSILETHYSGDSILLIFPDGTSPALLTSLISGIPLNRVHELEFSPGEVRLDVQYQSGLNFLAASTPSKDSTSSYMQSIEEGRKQLAYYRENNNKLMTRQQLKDHNAWIAHVNAEKENVDRAKATEKAQADHAYEARKKLSLQRKEANEERKRKLRERREQFGSSGAGIEIPSLTKKSSNQQQIAKHEVRSTDEIAEDNSMSVGLLGAVTLLGGIKFSLGDQNDDKEEEFNEITTGKVSSVSSLNEKTSHEADDASFEIQSHTVHVGEAPVIENINTNDDDNYKSTSVAVDDASIEVPTNSIVHDAIFTSVQPLTAISDSRSTNKKKVKTIITDTTVKDSSRNNGDVDDIATIIMDDDDTASSRAGTDAKDAFHPKYKETILDDATTHAIFDDYDEMSGNDTAGAAATSLLDTTITTISLNNEAAKVTSSTAAETKTKAKTPISGHEKVNFGDDEGIKQMEELFENAPFVIPETETNRANNDNKWSWDENLQEKEETKLMKERELLAKHAMDEYMDRDDGASDLDNLLKELMMD